MTVIVAWAVASAVVAGLLTAGAWLWERGARWSGRPARWGWLAALAGSVTLPFVARWLPQQSWSDVVPAGLVQLDALTVMTAATTPGPRLSVTDVAVAGWIVLSLCVVAYVVFVVTRLAQARRGWREAELDGARVLVSRNMGPAALGVRRGMVVIPAWALDLDEELRRLMLQHEREHVGAGDPRLLLGALLLAALMPWNPLVWLQLVRLRGAIELDCDARVLRRGADPASYGSLLLEVGQRRRGTPLVLATFAEPRLLLEERIRRIARWPLERRPVRAALLSVLALLLFSTALVARVQSVAVPSLSTEETAGEAALPAVQERLEEVAPFVSDTPPPVRPDPRQTPYTRAPQLRNTETALELLRTNYPPLLRDAGIGGTAAIWLLVTEQGAVQALQLSRGTGHPALDQAALKVASALEFMPAENEGRATAAWVEVPVAFGPLANSVTVNEQPVRTPQPQRQAVAADVSRAPTFTPMTKRPELRNPGDVQQALIRSYPPLLRDAGIGGTTVLWFFIDENGQVLKTQLHTSSGYPALDDAAARVAGTMQFGPAMNRDRTVPVWVEIPIVFTASGQLQRTPAEAGLRTRSDEIVVAGTPAQDRLMVRLRSEAGLPPVDPPVQPRREGNPLSVEQAGLPKQQAPVRSPAPPSTPMTKRPELVNASDVQRALVRNYPPILRDAGIGGTVTVWVYVDKEGRVERMQLSTSSGYPSLDEAGSAVASTFRFTPARNGDDIVAVWIEIPIVFTAR